MTSEMLKGIGDRICTKRKQLGLTQEQVADKMDVSIQMISNLERGNKAIKIDNLIKISEILGVSTDYILTGKNTTEDNSTLTSRISSLSKEDFEMIDMLVEYCIKKSE